MRNFVIYTLLYDGDEMKYCKIKIKSRGIRWTGTGARTGAIYALF
jgi:hypothetical protein